MPNGDANRASRAVVAGVYRQMVGAGETTPDRAACVDEIRPSVWPPARPEIRAAVPVRF